MDVNQIRITKLTLNMGCGNDQPKLEKAMKLLKAISKANPVKTYTRKRLPEFGLRPGLPIGAKVTLRKGQIKELLTRLLDAKENTLPESSFDDEGNVSFGIKEYIDIPGVKYMPEIGILGLNICVTLERAGYRVKLRRRVNRRVGQSHRVTQEDAMKFMKEEYNVGVGEE